MKKCWPCRRRRLKCDGSLPACRKCDEHGVGCTYTKPLTWVKGVASRGHFMNRTFGEPQLYTPQKDSTPGSPVHRGSGNRTRSELPPTPPRRSVEAPSLNLKLDALGGVSRPLVDPVLQDMGYNTRFLIDYYQRRVCPTMFFVDGAKNPYSQAVSMMSTSPALANAILAVAACHCAHSATGSPLVSLLNGRPQRLSPSSQTVFPTNPSSASSLSHSDLLNQYLVLKHNSLRLLSADLGDASSSRRSETLATVLFLALLELMESGAGFWSVHIEGAKKLLEEGVGIGTRSGASLVRAILDELILFDTFGSTLISPGVLTRSLRSRLHHVEDETPKATGVVCPTEIILLVDSVSSQRQQAPDLQPPDPSQSVCSLYSTLKQIQDFNVYGWATSVILSDVTDPAISLMDLTHVGTIWKLAAEIYTSRLLYNLTNDPTLLTPLVDVIRHEYELLGADHHFMNALIWPTFIAGAASTRPDQRDWAIKVLERIWEETLLANGKNAPLVLGRLWEKQDAERGAGAGELEGWDWISELSSLEDRWIFL